MIASAPELEKTRPVFVLTLRAEPQCPDVHRALKRLLKLALRKCHLRCVSIEQATLGKRGRPKKGEEGGS
jgi:hypothetical protein